MLVRLVPSEDPARPGSFQGVPRARHPRRRSGPWIGLWPRLRFPTTQRGLLVWKDGTVIAVEDWGDLPTWESVDLHILGGYQYVADDSHWSVPVLTAAGYAFEPVVPGTTPTP